MAEPQATTNFKAHNASGSNGGSYMTNFYKVNTLKSPQTLEFVSRNRNIYGPPFDILDHKTSINLRRWLAIAEDIEIYVWHSQW